VGGGNGVSGLAGGGPVHVAFVDHIHDGNRGAEVLVFREDYSGSV